LHAISLLRKRNAEAAGLDSLSSTPIAKAFNNLADEQREKIRVKFDIAHFVATANLPYTKYPKVCALEAHHGVEFGNSYTNETAGKEMIHYIAESRRQVLMKKLGDASFFSLLLDGSTDKGNIFNELIHIVWCDVNGTDEKVHTRSDCFTTVRPQSVTAEGLFKVLESGLHCLGINEISAEKCCKLEGIGTDGAAANIGAGKP
jgi:hypothetical protein